MALTLADSSAWIEYDRNTGSPVHLRLRALQDRPWELLVTEPVIAEVCMGARTHTGEHRLRRLLDRHRLARFEPGVDFDHAVAIYRSCRRRGVTPGSLIDCLIAAVAIRHEAVLLAGNGGFRAMAQVVDLRLDPASAA